MSTHEFPAKFKADVKEIVDLVASEYTAGYSYQWDTDDLDDPQCVVTIELMAQQDARGPITVTIGPDEQGDPAILCGDGDHYLELTFENWYAYLWIEAEQFIRDRCEVVR
mgnify:CR=1 FL=1